ncbi:hypothetical protein ACRAWG_26985 [Methylobacterium sp. P31]
MDDANAVENLNAESDDRRSINHFRINGDRIGFASFLKPVRKSRASARTFRVLSAFDDMLHDIGLDRRTLRTFCQHSCTHRPAPAHRSEAPGAIAAAGVFGMAAG